MAKSLRSILLACGVLLASTTLAVPAKLVWIATSQDPHDLARLRPYLRSQHAQGRLLIVDLARPVDQLPESIRKLVRGVPSSEIRQYIPALRPYLRPDPRVQALLATISPERLRADVTRLANFESRRARSAGNREAVEWIKSEFEKLGYRTTIDCYRTDECNVLAESPAPPFARGAGLEQALIVAHMDSVGQTKAGADDNASGTASALETARALAGRRSTHRVRFFITNGEENGLTGSTSWVGRQSADELASMKLVIAMDMVAWNSNGKVDLETNKEYQSLADNFADKVRLYTKLTPNITMPAWGSDHVPFLNRKVPTLLTIEHWDTKTPCYHKACDKPENLNYEYAAEITRLNTAMMIEAAGVDLP